MIPPNSLARRWRLDARQLLARHPLICVFYMATNVLWNGARPLLTPSAHA